MGVKRFHLQLAAKRRWQSQLGITEEREEETFWQGTSKQKRWSAQTAYDRFKDLP